MAINIESPSDKPRKDGISEVEDNRSNSVKFLENLVNGDGSGGPSLLNNAGYSRSDFDGVYDINEKWSVGKNLKVYGTEPKTEGVQSLFNRYSLFQYKGFSSSNFIAKDYINSPNSTLFSDDWYNASRNPTTRLIIEKFSNTGGESGLGLGLEYDWADFLYAKYHKKIPNNYMITLRRFAYPTGDNLFDPRVFNKNGDEIHTDQPDLARAVTWMGESTGNKLDELFEFTTGFELKPITAGVQALHSKSKGMDGSSLLDMTKGVGQSILNMSRGSNSSAARAESASAGYDPFEETYPNHTEGPINVIKELLIREPGLKFTQEFEIKFEYNLAAHGKINPKMAFLDVLANMLVLTYNSAPFWGGATRYIGNGNVGKPLGNFEELANGNILGFLKSVMGDVGSAISNVFGKDGQFSIKSVLGGMADVAGDMLGGWLSDNLNTPAGAQAANALLVGDPTGQWHLTIGNPMNPIAMIGNLQLEDAKFKLSGPLSADDFPTNLEVTITLKPGRPRDRADIESMFNCGRGRLYYTPEDLDEDLIAITESESSKVNPNGTTKPFDNGKTGQTGAVNKPGSKFIKDVDSEYGISQKTANVKDKIRPYIPFVTEG